MDPETEREAIAAVPTPPDAFTAALSLVAVALDAKATGARLRDLQEQTAAAIRAKAELAVAKEAYDQHVAATNAALAKRKSDLDASEQAQFEREQAWKEEKESSIERNRRAAEMDALVRRRLLHYAGHEVHPLQDLPDWNFVFEIYFGVRGALSPDVEEDQSSEAIDPGFEMKPAAGATITRSHSLPKSAAARRSLRRAAGVN